MDERLFASSGENKSFVEYISAKKINKIKLERKEYKSEIEKAIEESGRILERNGARCNFIAEILAKKDVIVSSYSKDVTRESIADENSIELDTLIAEYEEFIQTLSREDREDLAFYYPGQINDREVRTIKGKEEEDKTIERCPEVKTFDYEQATAILAPIFDIIDSYLLPEKGLEISEPVQEPDTTLEPGFGYFSPSKVLDDNNTKILPKRFKVLGIKSINPAKPELKEDQDEVGPITSTNFDFNDFGGENAKVEETESVFAPTEETTSIDSSVSFEIPNNVSLVDIASIIDNISWGAIYEPNKEMLDKIVIEKNDGNFAGIEHNPNIFAGTIIKIPTVFGVEPEKTPSMKLAA